MILPSLTTCIAILIIHGALFAMAHRIATTLLLTAYLMAMVLLLSTLKQGYLGSPASLADVVFFLHHPADNFRLFLAYPLLGMALLSVCLGFAGLLVAGLKLEHPLHHAVPWPRYRRLRWTTTGLSLFICAAGILVSNSLHARLTDEDAFDAFKSMYGVPQVDGVVSRLNYFFDNHSTDASLPARRPQSRFSAAQGSGALQPDLRPDILMVLEESIFDSTLIKDCAPAECDHAMLHPLPMAQRNQQGPLLVHSTGGGTWLSEFAFLSGYDWRVFGRGGAFAPISLAPRLHASLPDRLRKLGYRTIAIIPTDANFLSARSAYRYYGFDEFHSSEELHLPADWQAIRDHMLFDDALRLAQRAQQSQPVFVFVLTLRNHGPHGAGNVAIEPAFRHLQQTLGKELADYLGRMRDSSDDYLRLAQHWLQSSRPRVIGWFGDHQPEAAWNVTAQPDALVQDRIPANVTGRQVEYLTYFQMAANFGDADQTISSEALDIAYLGASLLSFAGLPEDAGLYAANTMAAQCHGMLLTCPDHALVDDYLSFRVHELGEVQ